MKLTLKDIKRIANLEFEPKLKEVRIPFYPMDDPRVARSFTSSTITPYLAILKWNEELQDYESNLEL